MPIVKMPDGVMVDMPDNLDPKTRAEMELYMSPPQPGVGQRVADQTAAIGREIGNEATNLPRTLGLFGRDLGTAATGTLSMISDPVNKLFGLQPVSQASQELMDRAGLPRPEPGLETGINDVATLGLGLLDPAAMGLTKLLGPAKGLFDAPSASAMRADRVNTAKDAGYKMTPAEAGAGPVARGLGWFAGNDTMEDMARYANQGVTDSLVRKQAGLGSNAPITGPVIEEAMANAIPARMPASQLSTLQQTLDQIRQVPIGANGHADATAFGNARAGGLPLPGHYGTIGDFADLAPELAGAQARKPSFFTNPEKAIMFGGLGSFYLPHVGAASALALSRGLIRNGIMSGPGQALMTNPQVEAGMPMWQNAVPTAFNMGTGLFGQ